MQRTYYAGVLVDRVDKEMLQFGPNMRACVLGRVAHTTGFGPVGAFSRLALLPPAARANSPFLPRGRSVSRCSPAGATQAPSPGSTSPTLRPGLPLPGLQAGRQVAIDGPSKRTNEESFILASHGEFLSTCVNRYLDEGFIQGPPDGLLSGGDVVHAEHPIFYDIEHCLEERYKTGRGVVRNGGRKSPMQGA